MSFDWATYIELARLLMERAEEIPTSKPVTGPQSVEPIMESIVCFAISPEILTRSLSPAMNIGSSKTAFGLIDTRSDQGLEITSKSCIRTEKKLIMMMNQRNRCATRANMFIKAQKLELAFKYKLLDLGQVLAWLACSLSVTVHYQALFCQMIIKISKFNRLSGYCLINSLNPLIFSCSCAKFMAKCSVRQ